MLEDGLGYPFRGEWVGRIVIGGALTLLSFLLLPILPVYGYLVRVLADTIDGAAEPPEWTDWGDLLVTGIASIVIVIAYAIVPLFVYGLVVFGLLGVGTAVGGHAGGYLAGMGVLSMLLLLPVIAFVYYLVPAALANYAQGGSFGAAFEFGTIASIVLSVDYLVAFLLPIVVAILLWIVTFLLMITFVGIVLIPFVQFYGQVAIFRMFGLAYRSVSGRTGSSGVATPA